MIPNFETFAIVFMSCAGAFVIGVVVGFAVRDEQELQARRAEYEAQLPKETNQR